MKTYLFSRLGLGSKAKHPWCGNDEKGKFTHHGVIPLAEDPTTIELNWKSDSGATPQYVGTYELHLKNLLDCGVIRKEKSDSVRVKFMNVDGLILLSTGQDKPYLLVGTTRK
jgi:hypothetical protein